MFGNRFADPVILLLTQCGAATLRQIASAPTPISPRWVTDFARSDGLISVATLDHSGSHTRYVALTPAGRRYVKERFGRLPYLHRSRQALHDITLAGYYLRLEPECRATWENPDELFLQLEKKRSKTWEEKAALEQRQSFPDGLYKRNGNIVVVEVAGRSLTEKQIQVKRDTAWTIWQTRDLVVVKAGQYGADDF